jgi:hypothetical protein
MRRKTIETDGSKLLLVRLKLIGSIRDYLGIFQLGPEQHEV